MDYESRKSHRGDTIVIQPPEGRGDLWVGSSHEDSWESLRAANKRMRESRGAVAFDA